MERVTVKKAAEIMGVSEQYIRIGLQQGVLPIGSAVLTSSTYTYHICPQKLADYMGIEVNEGWKKTTNRAV